MNYAYALEQLEAAFYSQVISTPYSGITSAENADFDRHPRSRKSLTANYSKPRSAKRRFRVCRSILPASISAAATAFSARRRFLKIWAFSAYNGAGQLLKDVNFLLLAGKIVSVEARHAATIRDLLSPMSASFAGDDAVDTNGLDKARMPSEVLAAAAPFIKTPVTAKNLPKLKN